LSHLKFSPFWIFYKLFINTLWFSKFTGWYLILSSRWGHFLSSSWDRHAGTWHNLETEESHIYSTLLILDFLMPLCPEILSRPLIFSESVDTSTISVPDSIKIHVFHNYDIDVLSLFQSLRLIQTWICPQYRLVCWDRSRREPMKNSLSLQDSSWGPGWPLCHI
jgi:hypothetical protein